MFRNKYMCRTCQCTFNEGVIVTDGVGGRHERCPYCQSWNYGLTGISVREADGAGYFVEYSCPSVGIVLYSSPDSTEAQRILNRMQSLKWDVFQALLAGNFVLERRKYLDNEPCLMNSFTPFSK